MKEQRNNINQTAQTPIKTHKNRGSLEIKYFTLNKHRFQKFLQYHSLHYYQQIETEVKMCWVRECVPSR